LRLDEKMKANNIKLKKLQELEAEGQMRLFP
jgi:hypothetical protein